MRGSHGSGNISINTTGIIPAHAGLTLVFDRTVVPAGDHPRACGAHALSAARSSLCSGSSPRMRGSLRLRLIPDTFDGIIPAHAGLTDIISCNHSTNRDHPRACGAHPPRIASDPNISGSSPRMRGSHAVADLIPAVFGIIPAHAGLTQQA